MKAAIYARVSTKDQDLELQLSALSDYAAARRFEVSNKYLDKGVSGSKESRPGIDALMDAARKRKIDVILVWRFDRFARSTKHLITALEEFKALGIDFISYQENVDTTSPAGKMMFTMISAFAEFEREIIRERVRAGVEKAKREGKRIGRPKIEPQIASKAVSMVRKGFSYGEVAAKLKIAKGTVHNIVNKSVQKGSVQCRA